MKKKKIKVRIDELIAGIQNDREAIDSVKEEIRQKAYDDRLLGINYNNPGISVESQRQKLLGMSREVFEQERMKQAELLFSAYHDHEAVINFSSAPAGKEFVEAVRRQRLNNDIVRQVLGKKMGDYYLYSTDILFLNRSTMMMIDAVEWGNSIFRSEVYSEKYDINRVSPRAFIDIVDELNAAITIMARKGIIPPDYRDITTQTDIIKRAIGMTKNGNIYNIDDFALNYDKMISQNTDLIKKAYKSIRKSFKEFINESNGRDNQNIKPDNYLGDQTVEIER